MKLGERIRELRSAKKISQEELGKVLGVSKVSISGYENSTREPDAESLIRLSKYFNVSVDYLLGRSGQKNSKDEVLDIADTYSRDEFLRYQGAPISDDDWEIIEAILKRKNSKGK